MSTKREILADPNSCLNLAGDDEPIFVLRANDPLAASTIRFWCLRYVATKQDHNTDGQLTGAQANKHNDALQVAQSMENWERLNRKRP